MNRPGVMLPSTLVLLALACARPDARPASITVIVPNAGADTPGESTPPSRGTTSKPHGMAAGTPDARARAEGLFSEAREAMRQGRLADACALFSQSLELEVAVGTLLNLATCLQQTGDTRGACEIFERARDLAQSQGQPERAQFAKSRLTALQCP